MIHVRTDFYQFLLWEGVVVILKELIFKSFYFREGMMVLKELIFNNVYYGEGLGILKELIFNNFYYGRVW